MVGRLPNDAALFGSTVAAANDQPPTRFALIDGSAALPMSDVSWTFRLAFPVNVALPLVSSEKVPCSADPLSRAPNRSSPRIELAEPSDALAANAGAVTPRPTVSAGALFGVEA